MIHEQIEPDRIIELAAANRWKEIEEQFKERHPADLAAVISDAPKMFRNHLFAIITEDLKPDVLAELEGFAEDEVLESLSNAEISEIVEDMDPDDAADVIAELPPDRSEKILDLMEDEESEEVRELLKYDEESAGGIMTPDVIALQADLTVEEAFARIAESDIDEPFFYAYIVDQNQTLMSFVGLWKLVRIKDRSRTLSDVATKDVISATADMDQEDVAKMMQKYNLTAIPVVDDQHRLVGRITADDVIDVLEDEASEDIFMLAGSDDDELIHPSPIRACRSRLPWILITLFAGFVASIVLKEFIDSLEQVILLAYFVPVVTAMGGSTGVQSSTLIVRSLALGTVDTDDLFKILGREVMTAAIMGLISAVIMAVWVKFIVATSGEPPPQYTPMFLAVTVGLALFAAMLFAAIYGAFIPIILERFKVDPAVASGPFVTASNDIAALVIYYGVTLGLIAAYY